MLVASDGLVSGTAIGARKARMSEGRVRIISLMGVVGTVAGFGIDLLFEVDESSTAFSIAGIGSVAGLALGANMTKNYDRGKSLALAPEYSKGNSCRVSPQLVLRPDPFQPGKRMLSAGLRLNF